MQQEVFGLTDSTFVLYRLDQLPRTWTSFVVIEWLKFKRFCRVPIGMTSLQQTTLLIALDVEQHWNCFNLQVFVEMDLNSYNRKIYGQKLSCSKMNQLKSGVKIRKEHYNPFSRNQVTQSFPLFRHDQYSSFCFSKLIRVAATVLIAVDKFKGINRSSVINTIDLASAKWKILQEHQRAYFAVEYQTVKSTKELSEQLNSQPDSIPR